MNCIAPLFTIPFLSVLGHLGDASNSSQYLSQDEIEYFMSRREDFGQSGVLIQSYSAQRYFTSSLIFEPIGHIDASYVWLFKLVHNLSGHSMWFRLNGYGDDTVDVLGLFQVGYDKQNDVFVFKNQRGLYLSMDSKGYGHSFRDMTNGESLDRAYFKVIGKEKSDLIAHSFPLFRLE